MLIPTGPTKTKKMRDYNIALVPGQNLAKVVYPLQDLFPYYIDDKQNPKTNTAPIPNLNLILILIMIVL